MPGRIPSAALVGDAISNQADDVVSIQAYTLEAEGTVYDVILRAHVEGYYRYPNIRQGFETVTMQTFYVLPLGSLGQIAEAARADGRAQNVSLIPVLADNWIDKDHLEAQFAAFLREGPPRFPQVKSLNIAVFPVTYEGRDVIRFQIVEGKDYSRWSFDPLSFDHYYFETPTAEFFEWLHEPVNATPVPESSESSTP